FLQAPVARAAALAPVRLAEVLDEGAMTAARAGRIAFHVAQQRARAFAPFAVGLEHLPPADEIADRVDQHTFRRQSVASGAARFLLIVLGRPRRAGVHDEADVGPIDPHPERHRRDDDVGMLVEKGFLMPAWYGTAR